MFIIDISVPRNIEPAVNDVENIYLYDVDDLQGVVDTNLDGRRKEAEHAGEIIAEETESFERWLSSQESVPAIVALRKMAEDIKEGELAKLTGKLRLPEKEQKAVECMASAIVNKLLHPPTAALKEEYEDREALIAALRKLFLQNGKFPTAPPDESE
jgi:glutamyl-tRNA reductase